MTDGARCDGCHYALLEDYGYSNYTVEGTYFHCLKRAHPVREGFDRWYGEDVRLRFAEQCPSFAPGKPVEVDVDYDEIPFNSLTYDADYARWWDFYLKDDEERRALAAALDAERKAKGFPDPQDDTAGKPEGER